MNNDYDLNYDDDEVAAAAAMGMDIGNSNSSNNNNTTTDPSVTATSYGALDTSMVTNECWMIRIPPKLAELFETVPEGVELGELIFTKGGMKSATDGTNTVIKPSLTVHISEDLVENYTKAQPTASATNKRGIDPSTLPLHYSLQAMTKKIPVMHPFVRQSQTGSCQLLGTVSRTGNLQVFQLCTIMTVLLIDL